MKKFEVLQNENNMLAKIYCTENSQFYAQRFLDIISKYETCFGKTDGATLFSAPGRTELGGNHTDHQRGCVLAGSVNLDIIACVALNGENVIRIQSEGYPMDEISLDESEVKTEEFNQAKALIRGVYAKFKDLGYNIKGFNAYTSSNVLKGSGLSSSAAFEVLIGNIFNGLFAGGEVSPVEIAQIGQFAENVYFGKPCGLMDQMASSIGGIIYIDFEKSEKPLIKIIDFDFSKCGYALCIIDSGADHAELTEEYAAIPKEMKEVAGYFNKEVLRDVCKDDFINTIPDIRSKFGDRAVLRALHFFNENERALMEAEALEKGDFDKFLELIKESGRSSYMYLQNVCVRGSIREQAVAVVLAFCEEFLKNNGAYRVHGGGFAGTVQAFVPISMLEEFKNRIERIIGKDNCHVLSIRPVGGIMLGRNYD